MDKSPTLNTDIWRKSESFEPITVGLWGHHDGVGIMERSCALFGKQTVGEIWGRGKITQTLSWRCIPILAINSGHGKVTQRQEWAQLVSAAEEETSILQVETGWPSCHSKTNISGAHSRVSMQQQTFCYTTWRNQRNSKNIIADAICHQYGGKLQICLVCGLGGYLSMHVFMYVNLHVYADVCACGGQRSTLSVQQMPVLFSQTESFIGTWGSWIRLG